MHAAVVNEQHGFDLIDVPDPSPQSGELLLRVSACGICGSDLKAVANMRAGLVMGHEFAGEIVAVAPDVRGWRVGQRVCALPLIGCGACAPCITGDVAHCATVDMIGVGGSAGAYAEYVRVSARETFELPDAVPTDLGALVEPLAVGLHAVERAALRAGDRVLVLGAGPVGLAVTLWARHLGAGEVVVSDPVPHRRTAAQSLGATGALDPSGGLPDDRYDVVFECVGVPGMLAAGIAATGTHGRLIVAGVCTKPDPFVPVQALVRELTMHFVMYYRRQDFAFTVDMLRRGRIDAGSLVTDRVDLEGFPAAFEALKHPTTQCKVLVLP
ncbi:MAG TPA: alcohol dehydrogenase catalytic domain-containing protein [Acidimicrobiales bacterium]|jgi:2-desacetyl-2-hydroxyethyl bacteriochlorophyllide A dehydrogenase|nr:alcohol dehydrogenase catalytic domain-containing protein [Acidimicrobiales bacterium]